MRYTFRPLGPWTDPVTKVRKGAHTFKASWGDTLDLLSRELEHLGATEAVIQVDLREHQLRRDGMPRADAKVGDFPGARVSFESKHGPLVYATDMYERWFGWSKLESWQANIRAIALSLQALRAVDRHGATHRAEQYRGWMALEAGAQPSLTRSAAQELIDFHGGVKRALLATHPDHGGDRTAFERVQEARRVLGI